MTRSKRLQTIVQLIESAEPHSRRITRRYEATASWPRKPTLTVCSTESTAGFGIIERPVDPERAGIVLRHPKNARFLTGKSRLLAGTNWVIFSILLVWVTISTVSLFDYHHIPLLRKERALDADGIQTQATIVSYRVSSDETSFYLTYQFRVPGTDDVYQREQRVSAANYELWRRSASVTVLYLPSDPTFSRLEGDTTEGRPGHDGVVGVAGNIIIASIGLAIQLKRIVRRFRIARDGHILGGVVSSARFWSDAEGKYWVERGYRFQTPSGKILHHKDTQSKQGHLPSVGDRVAVAYLSDETYQVL